LELGDEVGEEPRGGAHRYPLDTAQRLKAAIIRHLDQLEAMPRDELRAARSARIASFGVFSESSE
jgi:acetyl-CoA carboxylase carboxyl transferase subunit alpha